MEVEKDFRKLMTASFWKHYLYGNEELVITYSEANKMIAFVPDSFKILEDDSLELHLNKKTFEVANQIFRIDDLFEAREPVSNYYKNIKIVVRNKFKFNVYDAYMIYPDKCDKLNCILRPKFMSLVTNTK